MRFIIFFVAVAVRALLAYIFYGSIDVSAFIGINSHTLNQTLVTHPVAIWCSFPTFPFYLWFSGLLSVKTCLPIAFCFKILPIFFDGLFAVLLYDFVKTVREKHARTVGWLYALCPVSLIITCIHGQWDAMPLFCLILALYVRICCQQTRLAQVLYGALFAFSILLKPLSIILVPFFFMPIQGIPRQARDRLKSYISSQFFMVLGCVSMIAVCFACYAWYGLNVISIIDKVLRYLNKGQATLGLPLAYPFNTGILLLILKNRLWMMGLIAGIAWLYHINKLDVVTSMLLSFLIVYSFGLVSPQYFAWAIPLFLMAGFYRLLAGYTFLITLFCLFYYMNPLSNPVVPYQSMLSFASLRGWEWSMPSAWMMRESLVPVVQLLGNYLIPFYCMGSVVYILARSKQPVIDVIVQPLRLVYGYLGVLLGLTGLIAGLMLVFGVVGLAPVFNMLVEQRFDSYAVHMIDGKLCGAFGQSSVFNIAHVLLILLLGWCWYASISLYRDKKS